MGNEVKRIEQLEKDVKQLKAGSTAGDSYIEAKLKLIRSDMASDFSSLQKVEEKVSALEDKVAQMHKDVLELKRAQP